MRILVLTDRYPPYLIGGYEVACRNVAERLRGMGHDVRVLTSRYGVSKASTDGHVSRVLHRPQDCLSMFQLGWRDFQDRRVLVATMRRWRPDVVYAWCMNQLFSSLHRVLRDADVPVVLNIQDIWLPFQLRRAETDYELWRGVGKPTLKRLAIRGMSRLFGIQRERLRWSDVRVDNVVFCSAFRRQQHIDLGLPLGTGTVIYNGVELSAPRVERRRAAGIRVLFAGRLVSEKGAHLAVDAMKLIRQSSVDDVTLGIAGVPAHPWDYEKNLQQAVTSAGLEKQVLFLGTVAHEQMAGLYRDHDVLMFPSTGEEGLPVSIIEAMAAGLAVVATDTGGTSEIVRDGISGVLCASGDAAALARALLALRETPSAIDRFGAQGRAIVEQRFNLALIADQTARHLREASEQFQARRSGVAA